MFYSFYFYPCVYFGLLKEGRVKVNNFGVPLTVLAPQFEKPCSINLPLVQTTSVPVAARSKAYVFGRSPAVIVGSNPTGSMDVCLL